jgi:predicted esterase
MDILFKTLPPSAPHTHTVVFLHGRGDTAQSFASSLHHSRDSRNRSLPEIFPSFRWVFPQSEIRQCTVLSGDKISQGFDIWNINNFSEHEELQALGLRESVASVRRALANEAAVLGGQWDLSLSMDTKAPKTWRLSWVFMQDAFPRKITCWDQGCARPGRCA